MLPQSDTTELDHGPRSRGTERFCVVSRAVRPIEDMIRFVVAPNGEAVADLKHSLPGRGLWVTATRSALDRAVKVNAFARGFRRDVRHSMPWRWHERPGWSPWAWPRSRLRSGAMPLLRCCMRRKRRRTELKSSIPRESKAG